MPSASDRAEPEPAPSGDGAGEARPQDALQELVARAQHGDREAFGEIYVSCHGQIRGFLLRRVTEMETAEDLAQQVFVKAWQGLPRYRRTSAPFTAWLYRIARNTLIDHYRRSRPTVGLDGIDIPDESDRDSELIAAERFEEVERALEALREDYREVIRMRFLLGLSTREVAEAMDRSEGAVRVLQLRAVRALRLQLGVVEEAA